jgi:hypothetical protein
MMISAEILPVTVILTNRTLSTSQCCIHSEFIYFLVLHQIRVFNKRAVIPCLTFEGRHLGTLIRLFVMTSLVFYVKVALILYYLQRR